MEGYDGTVRLGALNLKYDRSEFDSEPDVSVSSPITRQKAAAAKQFIENHYKNYLQGLQDRKDRSAIFHFPYAAIISYERLLAFSSSFFVV